MAKAMLEDAGLPVTDENLFIAATCKEKGISFLKGEAKVMVRKKSPKTGSAEGGPAETPVAPASREGMRSFDVFVNNEYFKVEVGETNGAPTVTQGVMAAQQSTSQRAPAAAAQTRPAPAAVKTGGGGGEQAAGPAEGEVPVLAPLPGVVIRYEKKVGDKVKAGETIVIIEAMKMNNNIEAPCDGEVVQTPFQEGSSVAKENVLCVIKPS